MTMTISGDGTIGGLNAGGLPNATIVQADLATGVAGNGPAFIAYNLSTAQTISANTYTKIIVNTEEYDTASCYDTSTYRFQPNVAGYYQISGRYGYQPNTSNYNFPIIYKNGNIYKRGNTANPNGNYGGVLVSCLVYLNGSTDYVELWGHGAGSFSLETGVESVWFSGALVRAA